jgi:hypothetical protein
MPDHPTQPAPGPSATAVRPGSDAAEASPPADFLLKLVKAMKGAQFYPEDHPAFGAFLEKCHDAAAPLVSEYRALVFEAKSQRIHFAGKPVAPDLIELRHLAMECVYRRVKKFHVQEGMEARELEGFIRALITDPDVVQAAGGIEKVLFAKGIKNIWANEVIYQDLLYGDHTPEQPEEMFAPEPEGEGPAEPEEDPLALPPDATPRQEALVKLLQKLHAATDVKAYGELTASLVNLMQTADPPYEQEDTYRALRLLSTHASGREDREASIVPHALYAIRELATPDLYPLLLERLMRPGQQAAGRLMALFWQIGASVLPPLIEALAVAKAIHTRRVLSTAISGFGQQSRAARGLPRSAHRQGSAEGDRQDPFPRVPDHPRALPGACQGRSSAAGGLRPRRAAGSESRSRPGVHASPTRDLHESPVAEGGHQGAGQDQGPGGSSNTRPNPSAAVDARIQEERGAAPHGRPGPRANEQR